jgi:hypothetical protein
VEYAQFVEVCSLTNPRGRSLVSGAKIINSSSYFLEQAIITILKDGPLIILSAFIVVWFSFRMGFQCCWKPFRVVESKVSHSGSWISTEIRYFHIHLDQW